MAEELFHADTKTDERINRHKDVNSPFSHLFVRFQ